jgi:hypothetical protein
VFLHGTAPPPPIKCTSRLQDSGFESLGVRPATKALKTLGSRGKAMSLLQVPESQQQWAVPPHVSAK